MAEENKDKKIIDYIVGEFTRYEAFHKERFDKMRKVYDNWMNVPPKRDYDWQNAVHVPVTLESEQTITSRIFTALFPSDAPLDVQVEGDTPPIHGIIIKNLLQHFFRVTNAQGESWPTLTQNTLFGTAYVEAGSWYVKRGWVQDLMGDERYNTIIESRPQCKFVDFFEIFPHPAKLKMNDGLPLIRRRWVDAEQLKRQGELFNIDNLQEALDTESPVSSEYASANTKVKEYELLEYWGPWDESYIDKEGKETTRKAVPYWCMIINRSVKIKGMPNPYNHQMPPLCKTILFPNPRPSWFGIGVGEIGLTTQERLNKMVNQRLDNVDLVLCKQGFYNGNDPLINKNHLQVAKPGKWIRVSDTINSVRWMDTPDVTSSSYKEEELAKLDHREATGATEHLMPSPGAEQHRTAMGIQLLQGAAGMRFRPVLRNLEIDLVQEIAMFYFSNLKQFMTQPEWVMITGKNGMQQPILITPEQIQAKVYFIPTGISETMNKETQVSQLLRFKEITMNDPTINRQEINKRIAELMGFKDIEKIMVPQQQRAGVLDDQTQMQIDQRIAEGATPEQIKREFAGPRPPAPQQQIPQQAQPQGAMQ